MGIHPLGNFTSAIYVDVVRVKSYPTGVPMRVAINKLYLVSKRIMAGLAGGGLGTGESFINVLLFDSLMHIFPWFFDVDFTAFAGNRMKHAI